MVDHTKVFNFSAGPCILPKEVFRRAQEEMFDWHGSGLSVMEMSHRGTYFKEIIETTKKDLRTLMEIPDDFEIFFFQGGASQLFAGIPLNLIGDDTEAGATYLTTGLWSEGAYDEGCKYGKMTEAHNTKKHNYHDIDHHSEWKVDKDGKYFAFCSNETVQGFEFHEFPWEVVPKGMLVVCDMSSNFASKKIDWSRYDVVYAGAQKNVGPAGVCITIIKKSIIKPCKKDAPLMMDWALT